ncbi:MAG TPA: response regulator [Polyangia bacterium]|jgi:CheY-like chemotaxis protein|nr:response regulator [Polyangia bacterium]
MQTVLVVEDDDDLREVVTQTLQRNGFRVFGARDGQDALDKLAESRGSCLILLDLMMPRMSGWEFRRRQLADPRFAAMPVVVMTATATLDQAAIHADDILRKPLSFAALLTAVKRYAPHEPDDALSSTR